MSNQDITSHDSWERWLAEAQLVVSAAEVHGLIAGMMSSAENVTTKTWLPMFLDFANEGEAVAPRFKSKLEALAQWTKEKLQCPELSFELLIPADEAPIEDRIYALAAWAQGFLVGFGVNQQNLHQATPELKEGIQDLAEIARIIPDPVSDEESEKAFFEVAEYVRLTAIMCFAELGQLPASVVEKHSIH